MSWISLNFYIPPIWFANWLFTRLSPKEEKTEIFKFFTQSPSRINNAPNHWSKTCLIVKVNGKAKKGASNNQSTRQFIWVNLHTDSENAISEEALLLLTGNITSSVRLQGCKFHGYKNKTNTNIPFS